MSDLISRQAAIESLYKEIIKRRLLDDVNDGMLDEFDTEDILRKLPSAEPEIIRCKDCKYRDPEDKSCGCGHDIIWQLPRDDNWFCADGKRMVDDPSHPFANDVMMG